MIKTLVLSIVLILVVLAVLWWMVHTAFKVKRELDFDAQEDERRINKTESVNRELEDLIKQLEEKKEKI